MCKILRISRASVLGGLGAAIVAPTAALAASRQDQKRAFISQCDESISVEGLAGAPHKFVGKKVDLRGTVGPAMEDSNAFNLDGLNNPDAFVAVIWDAKNLEQGQRVRVLGVVDRPVSGETTTGGAVTTSVIRARYVD